MNLYDTLSSYVKDDYYPFHMPGHKRRAFLDMPSPFQIDITEIDGFDNLHEAEDILLHGMERTAKLYHTLNSFYLVNGSTSGLLAGIFAATKKQDTILMARNCHKAVYNAVMLRELKPKYLYPVMTGEFQIAGSIAAEDVKRAFKENTEIAAVVITSPTYDGITSNIKEIAEVVHSYGSILIVDEAHGAHFAFQESFPKSAVACGADIIIQSLHKTLPSLTQTALLHRNSERVSEGKLKKYLSTFQTSSPSYVFMAGIERCIDYLYDSKEDFNEYVKQIYKFYEETEGLKHITVWNPQKSSKIYEKDPSKIILGVKNKSISGVWLYKKLLEQYHIQPEMVAKDYVVCLSSVCDTKEGFERLKNAVYEIDELIDALYQASEAAVSHSIQIIANECVYLPGEMEQFSMITKPLMECEGEITAEYVYLYPPGIPLLVPGERVSKTILNQLEEYKRAGLSLRGMSDHTAKMLYVIER